MHCNKMSFVDFRSYMLIERSARTHDKHKEENNIDPDDGNSWLCSACKVPIFSTPFQMEPRSTGDALYRHDQCSHLPEEIGNSGLHPCTGTLMLQPNLQLETRCSKCKDVCGVDLYRCNKSYCSFQLDLKCARMITIVHQSHDHRLVVIRLGANHSFACGACGTVHPTGLSGAPPVTLVYVCNTCVFWLHPHCATLPNAILIEDRHPHPLLLIYGLRRSCKCAICEKEVDKELGVYFCPKCHYYVHIMCALTNNQSFKSVLLREARVPDMVCLPVPDEYTSIVRHLVTNSATTTSHDQGTLQHQHQLTLNHDYPPHGNDDVDDEHHSWLPTCNACVQFISPPFYTCSQCPFLFLHDCCARLPRRPAQSQLSLLPFHLNGPNKSFMPVAKTNCCNRPTNGFTYRGRGVAEFVMDVACGLMPFAITHYAHSRTHILFSEHIYDVQEAETCLCCGEVLWGVSYVCGICSGFRIHAKCARLPATVRHVYDPHPLQLITARPPPSQICDVCEQGLDDSRWYYGCTQCEQSFHVNCILCLDERSWINFRIAQVRLPSHDCSLSLVRGEEIRGRRCGDCGKGYKDSDTLAYQCFKCYYGVHARCANKIVDTKEKLPWSN